MSWMAVVVLLCAKSEVEPYRVELEVPFVELNHIEPPPGNMGFIQAVTQHQLIACEHGWAIDWFWCPGHIGKLAYNRRIVFLHKGKVVILRYFRGQEAWCGFDRWTEYQAEKQKRMFGIFSNVRRDEE